MNYQQRMRNRATADDLRRNARARAMLEHVCENCGARGGHWVETRGPSLQAFVTGKDDSEGFWTCAAAPQQPEGKP